MQILNIKKLMSFIDQNEKVDDFQKAEDNLNFILILKHTLELLPELQTTLKGLFSFNFQFICEVRNFHSNFNITNI